MLHLNNTQQYNIKNMILYITYEIVLLILFIYMLFAPISYVLDDNNIAILEKYSYITLPILFVYILFMVYSKLCISFYMYNKIIFNKQH
jgi:hypothetical protein